MLRIDEYLTTLKETEKLNNKRKDSIIEFYCKTCKLAKDPLLTHYFVERTPKTSKVFIIPQLRKVERLGIIFTENSMIAKPHFEDKNNHDWGQYQPEIIPFKNKS